MKRGRGSTGRFIRYLFQALLFVTVCFFGVHHSILSQSTDKIEIHAFVPSLDHGKSTQLPQSFKNLTESLPQWLVDYAKWHDDTRRIGDWDQQPVLIVVAKDEMAEGLSDRLRGLPFLLWEAHQTKRILLIQWLRPYPLEEFLLPPVGGIDWRVPPSLNLNEDSTDVAWHEYQEKFTSIASSPYQQFRVVKTQPNKYSFLEGMDLVYMTLNSAIQDVQLSSMYKLLLTPSPPVQRSLDYTMQQLGLVPKQFIGVHLRARYPDYVAAFNFIPKGWNETGIYKPKVDESGNRFTLIDPKGLAVDKEGILETAKVVGQLRQLVVNAIRCARLNLPDANPPTTIYFASDTNLAIKLAMNASENIVGCVTANERLHMNINNENHEYKPSDFYPAVVDLWILSQARCLAASQGGYTLFAAVLGGVGNCFVFTAVQNIYLVRHLPKGFITIRNITFCKPQSERSLRYWKDYFAAKARRINHTPKRKRYAAQATWNIGN